MKAPHRSHKRFTQTAIWATLERFWVQNPKYKKGTRGTQISLNSRLKTCLGFPLYTGRNRSETLILMGLGWVRNSIEKTICTTFDRSSLIHDRSSHVDLHSKSCRTLNSNFTYKHTLSKSKTKTKTFWSQFANNTN